MPKKSEVVLANFDQEVVDIEQEHQAMLAMFRHARQALAKEIAENKGGYITRDQANTLKELATGLDRITGMEIKLDNTREKRAEKMTQEDYLRAAAKLVQTLDHEARREWLWNAYRYHVSLARGGGPAPQIPPGLAPDVDPS